MARVKTLAGEMVTVTETKATANKHYFLVEGTAQGVMDFLGENHIPQANILHFSLVSSLWYCWYHK